MSDNDTVPSQVETIRILASIQTTNEFILQGMTDLKKEMGKVGEVVQAHAILLQSHSTELAVARREAEEAFKKAQDLSVRLAGIESKPAQAGHWSTDNVKAITTVGAVLYILFEIVKLLLQAALHPTTTAAAAAIQHLK